VGSNTLQTFVCQAPALKSVFLETASMESPSQSTHDTSRPTGDANVAPAEQPMSQLTSLLLELDESTGAALPAADAVKQDHLVESRLGVATGLFTSLRCKHALTASHSLRVALGCSSWGLSMALADELLDDLETAALLHDVGKIGVPDRILLKPGALSSDETVMMSRHREMGLAVLRSCCASEAVVEIVQYAPARFDGGRTEFDKAGKELPLGARMLSIVDAFDAMTTDHVYRRAMSRERALAELFECAGTQFDADLVEQFARLQELDQQEQSRRVSRRWLQDIADADSRPRWRIGEISPVQKSLIPEMLFHQRLLENMHDAVVYVDANKQIVYWNRGAERLTGISAASVFQKTWCPLLVGMRDEHAQQFEDDGPVSYAMRTGVQSLRRLTIVGRNQKETPIDFHVVPMSSEDGTNYGAALLLHDATSEISLEERCQSLQERATRDPLTQVANRAEFDRVFGLFVEAHLERKLPCSMIICDLDRFKSINDTYGHPAGDAVIKSFGQLLKSHCRPGDLVARYGGEEFVVLCADCTNAVAYERAESLRAAFGELHQECMGGARAAASFGVTEIQPGDSPATMLHRADRALLTAKDNGRNRVVQLGSGVGVDPKQERRSWWWSRGSAPDLLVQQDLITAVPVKIAVEKLRGFVADHGAVIVAIESDRVQLRIDALAPPASRRNGDRPLPLVVDLRFAHQATPLDYYADGVARTRIHAAIRLHKGRNRRRSEAVARARQLMASVRSYLMASLDHPPPASNRGILMRAVRAIAAWLTRSPDQS